MNVFAPRRLGSDIGYAELGSGGVREKEFRELLQGRRMGEEEIDEAVLLVESGDRERL
jgi:hypothetical protein